jgi:hypothetical protein
MKYERSRRGGVKYKAGAFFLLQTKRLSLRRNEKKRSRIKGG